MGNRTACMWFSADVWVWRKVAGHDLGPLYRKTHGVLTVSLGVLVLAVHWMASTGSLFR